MYGEGDDKMEEGFKIERLAREQAQREIRRDMDMKEEMKKFKR